MNAGTPRALIVAATPALQAKVALHLVSLGVEVIFASDAKEALALVEASAVARSPWPMPDLAILAGDLPAALGLDLVVSLRSRQFVGPVVVLAGALPPDVPLLGNGGAAQGTATGIVETCSSVEGLRTVIERVLAPGPNEARQPAWER